MQSTVGSGVNLAIATASASTLKIDSSITLPAAITINNTNQTLEIGTGGNLTISAAESITNGTVLLSGGTLHDASGITVDSYSHD